MKNSIAAGLMALIFIQCNSIKPENASGFMCIHLSSPLCFKENTTLSSVHCLLYRGSHKIINQRFSQEAGQFQIALKALIPAEDYTLLLWGNQDTGKTKARAFASGIHVLAGDTTKVDLSWERFSLDPVIPEEGSAFSASRMDFQWAASESMQLFHFQIDTSNRFVLPLYQTDTLTTHGFSLPVPWGDGPYFWRIRAMDGEGYWAAWSNANAFSIDTQAPGTPRLTHPENQSNVAGTYIVFEWDDVNDVDHYQLQINNDSTFSNPLYDIPHLIVSSFFVATYTSAASLPDPGTYYWRVRACDKLENWGEWSDFFQFTRIAI